MMRSGLSIYESGDAALRVTAATGDRELDWRLVHELARHVNGTVIPGILGCIPTYDALLIEFDPVETSHDLLEPFLEHVIADLDPTANPFREAKEFAVPVLYGGEMGPDLADVAAQQGLTPDAVIELHQAHPYLIRCLGAPGGSPMADGPAFPLPVSRLASPRVSVPQGAVAVAGRQATIAPAPAPGGWALLGRTPLRMMNLEREPLVPYQPGDRLTFHSISEREFDVLLGTEMKALND
jgi:KipI family sensor histidine kinase inhibitor